MRRTYIPPLTDGIYVLNYLFTPSPSPPAPHDFCGQDASDDALGCEKRHACP